MIKKLFLLFLLTFFATISKPYAKNNLSDSFTDLFNPQKYPAAATFYTADDTPLKLSDFDGKVIVLNLWKATCRTCLIELPALNALAEKYPDIAVLAVSEGDENAIFIDNILHKERRLNNLNVYLDKNQALMKIMGGGKVPQTYLIDKTGKVRGHIKGGADFNADQIQKQIDALR